MFLEKVIIGTVQFGLNYGIANTLGKINYTRGSEIIRLAEKHNISTLDTAIAYGDSEILLGQIGIDNWKVISKLPPLETNLESKVLEGKIYSLIQSSLRNLNIKKLYGILLHSPEDLLSKNGSQIYKTLIDLKNNKLVEKIGISIYDPNCLDLYLEHFDLDIVQAPFNILDRRIKEQGYLDKLKNKNIEFHCRSIFLQGLLLMNRSELLAKFNKWEYVWDKMENFASNNGISNLDICTAFIKQNTDVDRVIIGVDSKIHLDEIIASCNKDINTVPEIEIENDRLELLNPSNWNNL
ncbi:aldo/keto reductase [Leptospira sp. GIMC2001]|uniref:aldo/keto reductase n=1 Tax=Leptospira sp. GIMC2001 TaxID=1513297 RepID=UPI00234B256C|nr:aldo/keto reductase [Leptospira sp. GIMC2001]WCL51221.1 aldo/keto reductase [Leptospira sp. GIMC2001]